MKEIPLFYVESYDDSIEKFEEILKIFKTKGLIKLQGHKFSPEEQLSLAAKLGSVFGWHINLQSVSIPPTEDQLNTHVFVGGHSDDPNRGKTSATDFLLDWHIEQVFYVKTFLASLWNMFHVGYTNKKAGNTLFVDSCELYDSFSENEQNFLENCIVTWDKPIGPKSGYGPFYTRVVDTGPINGRKTLRLETDQGCIIHPTLVRYGTEEPTPEQVSKFEELSSQIKKKLTDNEDLHYRQSWEEGDMLVVDLFRMYHSVTGGFGFGERKFYSIFARPEDYTSEVYDSLEKLWTEN